MEQTQSAAKSVRPILLQSLCCLIGFQSLCWRRFTSGSTSLGWTVPRNFSRCVGVDSPPVALRLVGLSPETFSLDDDGNATCHYRTTFLHPGTKAGIVFTIGGTKA